MDLSRRKFLGAIGAASLASSSKIDAHAQKEPAEYGAVTRNGAYLTWEEKTKGTLEPGRLADMIVLPEDPLSIGPEKLLNLKVDMTIVGGKVLYDREVS
jgi:hypothetical protein